jgi:hypothetical protein
MEIGWYDLALLNADRSLTAQPSFHGGVAVMFLRHARDSLPKVLWHQSENAAPLTYLLPPLCFP